MIQPSDRPPMQAEHICDVSYRHAGAALCHRLSQSPSQSGMPIKPGHTLQVASASSTVQTIECQVEKHRQAQHGKIPDSAPDSLMNLVAGLGVDTTGEPRPVRRENDT